MELKKKGNAYLLTGAICFLASIIQMILGNTLFAVILVFCAVIAVAKATSQL